jgi:predicted acyl esterase
MRESPLCWPMLPRLAAPLTLALAALALAGCLASPAPFPGLAGDAAVALLGLASIEPFEVAAPDGTVLRGHVYLPEGEGPFATVLIFSPYWDNLSPPTEASWEEVDGRRVVRGVVGQNLTSHGFAVALVSLRGTGQSDGCFQFMNPQDGPDGRAVVEALASQPWSNGNVGMYGGSYSGWSQDVLLRDPPPALKAVVPYSSVQDLWSLVTYHGAPRTLVPLLNADWTLGTGVNTFSIAGPVVNGRLVREDARANNLRPDHLCQDSVHSNVDGALLMVDGDKATWWEERDNRPGIAASAVPTYVFHGLTNGEGHLAQLDGRWARSPAPQRWTIGQWGHSAHGSVVEDLGLRMVQWYDQWLRSGPALQATGVVEYQDDQGAWHEATAWPPSGGRVTLHLAGLELATVPGGQPQSFLAADLGGANPALCSPDQVLYVSPPLAEDILLAGHFVLNASLRSTAPDANVAATLFHTASKGPVCPDEGAEQVRYAITDLRHRGHLEQGEDFPLDRPERIVVDSVPFATPVKAGERLVLGIAGGDARVQPKGTKAMLTIEEGTLELTVVQGLLRFATPAQGSAGPGSDEPAPGWPTLAQ